MHWMEMQEPLLPETDGHLSAGPCFGIENNKQIRPGEFK